MHGLAGDLEHGLVLRVLVELARVAGVLELGQERRVDLFEKRAGKKMRH